MVDNVYLCQQCHALDITVPKFSGICSSCNHQNGSNTLGSIARIVQANIKKENAA